MTEHVINVTVNGISVERTVPSRLLLTDFLRHHLDLKGTHVGCEHGVCGCCTILLNGDAVRSCLLFAAQADQADIRTVEGLAGDQPLHPIQEAMKAHHGLQCGFCTPGFLMSIDAYLREREPGVIPEDDEIREALAGNLCRCTGYQHIVAAVRSLVETEERSER